MSGNAIGARKAAAARAGMTLDAYNARIAGGEKFCWACRVWHPVAAFGKDSTRGDGLVPACRESKNGAARAGYTPRPRRSRLGVTLVPARPGDRRQARARVNHLVALGVIPTPNSLICTDCGHAWAPGERRHEYDHHLGYAPEHQLDVQPVCTTCHAKREAGRGARGRPGSRRTTTPEVSLG